MPGIIHYYAPDGMPLVLFRPADEPLTEPTVTVSMADKWYECLYVVHPDDRVVALECPRALWHPDHTLRPIKLELHIEALGLQLDTNSFEFIIGRWVRRTMEMRPFEE